MSKRKNKSKQKRRESSLRGKARRYDLFADKLRAKVLDGWDGVDEQESCIFDLVEKKTILEGVLYAVSKSLLDALSIDTRLPEAGTKERLAESMSAFANDDLHYLPADRVVIELERGVFLLNWTYDTLLIEKRNNELAFCFASEAAVTGLAFPLDMTLQDLYDTADVFDRKITALLISTAKQIITFLSCHNVTYQTLHRAQPRPEKVPKDVDAEDLKRVIREVCIDRTVKKYDGDAEIETEARGEKRYLEVVPGTVHRWWYCASCDKLHRKDLLGQPCRNEDCGKIVSLEENSIRKAYWHPPHVRGREKPKRPTTGVTILR